MAQHQIQSGWRKKTGFTLTEVLVTLAIIGVVAALTIPSLVQSIQINQYKAAFKKNYSVLSNTTSRIIADNSNIAAVLSSHNNTRNEYGKYLNFVKKCDSSTPMDGLCWPTSTKYLNGALIGATSTNTVSMATLSDGSFLSFHHNTTLCQGGTISPCLGYIDVDVNGFKEPNTMGKDIYRVFITPTSLVPSVPNGFYGCDPTANAGRLYLGEACASLVLLNTDY